MADRHVHWWDEVVSNDEEDASFLPPLPNRSSPSTTNPEDDDSHSDSTSPQTPPTVLPPMSSSTDVYQSRHHARGMLPPIRVPVFSFADVRIRSPDGPSWRHGEPSYSPPGPSPRKSSAPGLPRHSRRDSFSIPGLHPLLAHAPSANTLALIWDVGDVPSYATVLMTAPDTKGELVPVPPDILNQAATSPPQREMRIHCVNHSLWSPLLLRADSMRSPQAAGGRGSGRATSSHSREQTPANAVEYIAVKHVILGIFNYLHTGMSSWEYDALDNQPIPGLQTSVARSFYRRCEPEERRVLAQQIVPSRQRFNTQSPISPSRERSGANISASTARTGGLRRLDCLLGQTRFLGLKDVEEQPHEWYMLVQAPTS